MGYLHKGLAAGRWQTMTLAEQMGNIGSEVSRAARAQPTDSKRCEAAALRAMELIDLTVSDIRWHKRHRLKELGRARELMRDALTGGHEYQTTWQDLTHYFDPFAFVARKNV